MTITFLDTFGMSLGSTRASALQSACAISLIGSSGDDEHVRFTMEVCGMRLREIAECLAKIGEGR